MDEDSRSLESMRSATLSLNQLVTIISGIAITIAITQLMSVTVRDGIYGVGRIQLIPALLFSTSILITVRFYHGNTRHLDEEYKGRAGKGYATLTSSRVSSRVAADFVVIVSEALIVTVLAFLIKAPRQYIFWLSALLLLDAVWFFFFHNADNERSKTWAANNLAFGLFLLLIGIYFPSHASNVDSRIFAIVMTCLTVANTSIDVINEFHFYFPEPRRGRTVFLAAPFTGMLSERNVIEEGQFKSDIMDIIQYLRRNRYHIFSAHTRERWGENLYSPANALEADISGLSRADVVLALSSGSVSPGVQLELGAALALGKPIVEIYRPSSISGATSYLNAAFSDDEFSRRRNTKVIEFHSHEELHEALNNVLSDLRIGQ